MQIRQRVRCPNCGCEAKRCYFTNEQPGHQHCPDRQTIQTECPACDYLMVMCASTGRVIEAYAPGISVLAECVQYSPTADAASMQRYRKAGNPIAIAAPVKRATIDVVCA